MYMLLLSLIWTTVFGVPVGQTDGRQLLQLALERVKTDQVAQESLLPKFHLLHRLKLQKSMSSVLPKESSNQLGDVGQQEPADIGHTEPDLDTKLRDTADVLALSKVGDNGLTETTKTSKDLIATVFNKRNNDHAKQEKNSSSDVQPSVKLTNGLLHMITLPLISVHTITYSQPDKPSHWVEVPLMPDMSVLRALIHAAGEFKETNVDVGDDLNPFNAGLRWDEELGCYVIAELLGVENETEKFWAFAVLSHDEKVHYLDRCLPYEDEIVLRPLDQVLLFHM